MSILMCRVGNILVYTYFCTPGTPARSEFFSNVHCSVIIGIARASRKGLATINTPLLVLGNRSVQPDHSKNGYIVDSNLGRTHHIEADDDARTAIVREMSIPPFP